jgi:hypothetical protein
MPNPVVGPPGAQFVEFRHLRRDQHRLRKAMTTKAHATDANRSPLTLPIYGDMVPKIEMALSASDPGSGMGASDPWPFR